MALGDGDREAAEEFGTWVGRRDGSLIPQFAPRGATHSIRRSYFVRKKERKTGR